MDEEIENPETLKIFRLNYEKDIQLFSQRNKELIKLFPKLSEAINDVFTQISPSGRFEIIIYLLGRVSVRHYESLVLLCINGFGFRAMAVLRSLFEKSVDSFYLNHNPHELDDFIYYELVQLKKTGYEDLARKKEPKFEEKIEKFRNTNHKGLRTSWSAENFVRRAESIGVSEFWINHAYRIPSEFIHTSVGELESSAIINAKGILEPVESDNEQERRYADLAFPLASRILIEVLKNQIACFDLQGCTYLEEYESELNNYNESVFD